MGGGVETFLAPLSRRSCSSAALIWGHLAAPRPLFALSRGGPVQPKVPALDGAPRHTLAKEANARGWCAVASESAAGPFIFQLLRGVSGGGVTSPVDT